MSVRTSILASLLVFAACKSAPEAPCPDTQAIVEAVAKAHPDCVRLTVHKTPPAGGDVCAVASTSADKLGKPSDPEDLKAMQTGETVVLDEPGAIDVTVPVMAENGKHMAAVGVTLKAGAGTDRARVVAMAKEIAMAVETRMAKGG